jgi:uncharacterized protein YqhQ
MQCFIFCILFVIETDLTTEFFTRYYHTMVQNTIKGFFRCVIFILRVNDYDDKNDSH